MGRVGLSPRMPRGSSPHLTPPHWPLLTFSPLSLRLPLPVRVGSFCAGPGPCCHLQRAKCASTRINTISPCGGGVPAATRKSQALGGSCGESWGRGLRGPHFGSFQASDETVMIKHKPEEGPVNLEVTAIAVY